MSGRIIIQDYQADWPQRFEQEAEQIQTAIGPWLVRLEHVGSTSVPNLAAKPIIDMLGGVRQLSDVVQFCVGPLAHLGYEYVPEFEDQLPLRRYFRKSDAQGVRRFHLHIYVLESAGWQRHLYFRDYLRAHPEQAQAYEALKRDLASRYDDTHAYTDAKSDFIQATEQAAREWKGTSL